MTIALTDEPIIDPEQDKLGVKIIAENLATIIREMDAPTGVAFGINGSWGMGKTSLIKLVEHYLQEKEKREKEDAENTKVEIVHFHCWWFNNEEALILNFLQTLHASLDEGLKGKAEKMFSAVLKSRALLKPIVQIALNPTVGGAAQALTSMSDSFFNAEENKNMDSLFQNLSEALKGEKKRYLIIIDDIDRLSAAEMTMMFRLVKTLGHLPNVVYLLAFDRRLAEESLSLSYPSAGPHFLEKIIQSFINIPVPNEALLRELVNDEVERILEDTIQLGPDDEQLGLGDVTRAICYAYIHTPRDFKRYKNALLTTYPAVKGKVYAMDYLIMEAWRIFEPELHAYIESKCPMRNMSFLMPSSILNTVLTSFQSDLLHTKIPKKIKKAFERIVCDIFPTKNDDNYANQKRISSIVHFETYFYWSPEAIPRRWLSKEEAENA